MGLNAVKHRKIIRDLIVPSTRVCHALTRVTFLFPLKSVLITALFLVLSSSLAATSIENQLDRDRYQASDLQGSQRFISGDPQAMARWDFEGPVLYNPEQEVKDHSIVIKDGVFHIFYIVANDRNFGHATSTDLARWEFHDPVLEKGEPGEWDSKDIWAPCVVPLEGFEDYYIMFYTGINQYSAQQTGLAISYGDLFVWIKSQNELVEPFACDSSWCNWAVDKYCHFRDPNFFEDESGTYLTQTTRTKEDFGAVALTSGDGRFLWSDAGPMYVHENWHLLESTKVLKRNGVYHLFFTEEGVGGTSHMFSDSLRSGWDVTYRSIIDFGHAPEITVTPDGAEIFSRHTSYLDYAGHNVYSIRFDTLSWSGDHVVVDKEPPLGEWTELWGDAFDHQPVFGNAFYFRGDDTTVVGFEGNWWIGTAERFDGPFFGYRPGSRQGDGPRGAIRSQTFTATGRSMKLLVGGGDYPDSCYVALFDAATGKMLYRETGRGVEEMDVRYWDLEPYMGTELYIEIVDDCSVPMGHINVDSIEEHAAPAPPWASPPLGNEAIPIEDTSGGPSASSAKASPDSGQPAYPTGEVACSPNPFNPATTITFTAAPGRPAEVVVFSIAGKKIRSETVLTSEDGTGRSVWDGRSDSGRPVASGIYAAAVFAEGRLVGMTKLILLR